MHYGEHSTSTSIQIGTDVISIEVNLKKNTGRFNPLFSHFSPSLAYSRSIIGGSSLVAGSKIDSLD
jgi:hypothetical protein